MSSDELPLEFLKLVTGDAIIGKVDQTTEKIIRVYEPLSFETGAASNEDLSHRYVFMSRYAPFLKEQVIDIELQKVIYHGPPSASVVRYYEASLAFCQSNTDEDFEECLNETSSQMEAAVSQMEIENAIINTPIEKDDAEAFTNQVLKNIILAAIPTGNSVH